MTSEELNKLAHGLLDVAKGLLAEDGNLAPVAFLATSDGTVHATHLSFGSTAEKRKVYRALESAIVKLSPDGIIMINDSWYKNVPQGDIAAVERMEAHGVVAEPDRKEAITVTVSHKNAQDRIISLPYHRDNGSIVWEDLIEQESGVENRLIPPNWKLRQSAEKASEN